MNVFDRIVKALQNSTEWFVFNIKGQKLVIRDMILDRTHARQNNTELPKMSDRIAVVTGGTRGIGLSVVKMLLQCDIHVIIACRDLSRGEKAIQSIRSSGITTGTAKTMKLDNSSLESVRNFVEEFKSKYDKLDILINNAGIFCPPYEETKDGFESQYGVNYLSHFLLTMLLIPSLRAVKDSRIVMVSSCAYELGQIYFNDINRKNDYLSIAGYGQSKLAQIMLTKKLAKYFKEKNISIKINAVHPGIVNTDIFSNTDNYTRHFRALGRILLKSPTEGAMCVIFAAVSPKLENKSGLYFYNCQERSTLPHANNETEHDRLFLLSLKQAQIQNFTL